jgi:translation initiation factor RLI1
VPFHGFVSGVEIDEVQGTELLVDDSGMGIATQLGQFAVTWEVTVNLSNGSGNCSHSRRPNLLYPGQGRQSDFTDVGAAEHVCRELGLDDLRSRLPAGLLQTIGETGWQLSHGERSRLYMARVLLQEADFVILDESFTALDPETLDRCLSCVLKRTATVLVIAHS